MLCRIGGSVLAHFDGVDRIRYIAVYASKTSATLKLMAAIHPKRGTTAAARVLRLWFGAGLVLLGAALSVPARAQDSENLHEQVMTIPLWDGAVPAALVATAYKPDGHGPFPLVILSHGSPGSAAERERMGRYRVLSRIREFVRRGFATPAGLGRSGMAVATPRIFTVPVWKLRPI